MQKMEKLIINIFTESELVQLLKEAGFPGFRGKQIFQWLHRHLVSDFAAMTNLPGQLIDYLQESFTITQLVVLQQQVSKDGTVKYLFQLPDGQTIETVLILKESAIQSVFHPGRLCYGVYFLCYW